MTARKTSEIREVLDRASGEAERLQLSKERLLEASLNAALGSLKQNYNVDDPFVPAGSDSADYFKMFENVAERFEHLGKELLKMRSSFLPFKMIENALKDIEEPGSGKSKKISEIIDADTALESYENTFFRLLGMPAYHPDTGQGDIRDKSLTTVTQKGKKVGWISDPERQAARSQEMIERTNEVLEKRARAISDRIDFPSSTSYDFLSGSVASLDRVAQVGYDKEKVKALEEMLKKMRELSITRNRDLTSTNMANSLISLMNKHRNVKRDAAVEQIREVDELRIIFGKNPPRGLQPPAQKLFRMLEIALLWLDPQLGSKVTLSMREHLYNQHVNKIENATQMMLHSDSNFWQYSYLLFPPVQDAVVATCINEPSKMVAPPFLPESERTVNGHKMQSTLLEAIIRIRLDIVSGFPHEAAQLNKSGMAADIPTEKSQSRPLNPEEMGLLEALLIVRLFSALHGFARDVNKKIKVAHEAQHRSKISSSPAKRPKTDHTPGKTEQKSKTPKQLELESLLLVEESLLLLFGDSSVPEALSYQEGIARNAGVKKAHLMGAAISVLDVPRRWAEQELGKIKEVQSRAAEKENADATGALRAQLGIAKGVGAIDMLAFLIALFTAKEVTLLSLLSDKSYGYLKKEYPVGFFDKFEREKCETGKAVNLIADRAFDAYQLFKFMLTDVKAKFKHATETD